MKNIRLQYVSKDDKMLVFHLPNSLLIDAGWKPGDLVKIAIGDNGDINLSNTARNTEAKECLEAMDDDLYAIYGGD